MSRAGTQQYIEEIRALQQKYSGSIRLLLGIELDRYADTDISPYDYLIGSVHYIFTEEGKRKWNAIIAAIHIFSQRLARPSPITKWPAAWNSCCANCTPWGR
jgi:histidinol phosphatase-like PHP family hydrolase